MSVNHVHIPWGMLFRKMYCHCCGTKLKRNRDMKKFLLDDKWFKRKTVWVGEPFTARYVENGSKYVEAKYGYRCPSCGNRTSYEHQKEIAKIQKREGKKIVPYAFGTDYEVVLTESLDR